MDHLTIPLASWGKLTLAKQTVILANFPTFGDSEKKEVRIYYNALKVDIFKFF